MLHHLTECPLLTWMSDHESDVFVVATSNDIGKLPPELSRAERFDGVWFLDLPSVQQRRGIWHIYLDLFGLDPKQARPVDADWTGAEIRSCCRLAALLDVPLVEAARNVVPVARTAPNRSNGCEPGPAAAASTPTRPAASIPPVPTAGQR